MNIKKYIPYILCLIIFIFISLRPIEYQIVGNDSYYFLNYIFGYNTDISQSAPLSALIFGILPANIWIIRLIMLFVSFITIYIFTKCSELYNPGSGWIAGSMLMCGAFFTKFLFELEDDLFAMPFIFLGLYFIIKYQLDKKNKYIYFSLLSIGIACLLWKFSIFYFILFIFLTNFNKIYLFCSIGLIPFIKTIYNYIFAGLATTINEYQPIFALLSISIFLLFGLNKKYRIKENFIGLLIFIFLAILNSKFVIVVFPILILNIAKSIELYNKEHKILLFLFCLLYFIALTISFIWAYPNNQINELFIVAQTTKKTSYPELEVKPYWGFGHYYIFYTKKYYPDYGSYKPTPQKGIIITYPNDTSVDWCNFITKNKIGKVVICSDL